MLEYFTANLVDISLCVLLFLYFTKLNHWEFCNSIDQNSSFAQELQSEWVFNSYIHCPLLSEIIMVSGRQMSELYIKLGCVITLMS